jgi:hypothetical protein
MRKYVIMLLVLVSSSCSPHQDMRLEKFDRAKWLVHENATYPYRDAMLHDLVFNQKLRGLSMKEVVDMLGEPNRIQEGHLYYTVHRDEIGKFTLHTRTLVLKLGTDSTVEWRKIHE